MALKDHGRREPTLADLEAFERLLRDSLHSAPEPAMPHTGPTAPAPTDASGRPPDAFAELTRLIEAPLPFGPSSAPVSQVAAPAEPAIVPRYAPVEYGLDPSSAGQGAEPMAPGSWQHLDAIPEASSEKTVLMPRPAPSMDPMQAFEEELRRFDTRPAAPVDTVSAEFEALRASYAGATTPDQVLEQSSSGYRDPYAEASWGAEPAQAPDALSPLAEAEKRLAAEAAVAAAAAGAAAGGAARSRKIFLGLGGVAVAGLAAIALSFAFGGKKATQSAGIPVVAAKPEPTKERPANPGGVEIPNQNKQIMAPKSAAEPPKPAQAVNTTEQPIDLNQVTRRESVRIVAPSPYQAPPPVAPPVPAAPPSPPPAAAIAPAPTPAPPAASASAADPTGPRRVQSVRLGDPAPPAPVAQPSTTPTARPGAIGPIPTLAGIAAGASATPPAAPAAEAAPVPTNAPVPPVRIVRTTTPPAPKVEARPQTATSPPPPVPAAPAAAPAPRPPRSANAPLSLSPAAPARQQPAAAAAGASGGWAIQLASRPTEADAQSASGQLAGRYAGSLGGKRPSVVSGQANGRTVYRVRVTGYSQADANAACARIKAAGGACFVTR